MKENIISFGKINKYSSYIMLSIIFLICNKALYGFNHNESFKKATFFPINEKENEDEDEDKYDFSKHNLIHYIVSYIGTFILGIIFYKLEIKASKIKKSIKMSESDKEKKERSNSEIKSIYNSNYQSYIFNSKNLVLIILITLMLWVLEEHLIDLYSKVLKDLDFWMIELLIISYINSKIFNNSIYKHQKLVFILNIIPCILKIMTIILSFYEDSNGDNEEIIYKNEPIYLIGIIVYLILIILRSYVNTKIKWLMDLKYISLSRLLLLYGLIGIIMSSVACTITTFISCSNCLCQIFNIEDKKNYFDNFDVYFTEFKGLEEKEKIIEIIIKIIGAITFFFNKYFSLLIIKHLSPVYVIFSFPIFFFLKKIILILNTFIFKGSFFDKSEPIRNTKFFLDLSSDIISVFGFLIYLEIIILNFCKFNYNIKYNIILRSIEDQQSLTIYDDVDNDEEKEKEEDQEITSVELTKILI
jgi:hypothetical protein